MKASLKLVAAVALVLWWPGLGIGQDQKPSGEAQPAQPDPNAPQTSAPAPPQEPSATPPSQTDEQKSVQPNKALSGPAQPCVTCAPPAKATTVKRKRRKKAVCATAAPHLNVNGALAGRSTGASTGTSTETSAAMPGKTVVRNGGAKDNTVQLSPGGGRDQDSHSRESTAQLLATTDANLKKLASRHLTSSQQVTLDQIHAYVVQAKLASDAGDLIRAHTLASKARLLSDDLSKP